MDGSKLFAQRIALGARHSCIVAAAGQVACWGDNQFAQLGSPELDAGPESKRARAGRVPALEDVRTLAAGSWHTCALQSNGMVKCWGHGGFGQLGGGDTADRNEPIKLEAIENVTEIAAGRGHTCARAQGGRVWCWGANEHGQIGDGTHDARSSPTPVAGIDDAIAVAAGGDHTCALRRSSDVWCWGMAVDGQLGDGQRGGARGDRATPERVDLDEEVRAVACGAVHTCAVLRQGDVRCWGSNDSGQLGNGRGGAPNAIAARPTSMERQDVDVAELALGGRFTCFRGKDASVRCTGFNHFGQLGDGTQEQRRVPVAVDGLKQVTEVAAGARHACVLSDDGRVMCWGAGGRGQLGSGDTEDHSNPVRVQGLAALDL